LFVGVTIGPTIAQNTEESQTSRGNWLYVGGSGPGNYTRIQDAIDNSSDGDTVFVYDDSSPYIENVIVNKSINLFGEKKETTIIDAGGYGYGILLSKQNINLTGFTIENSDRYHSLITMSHSNFSIISQNIIQNNVGNGILILNSSNNNIITENILKNNSDGIIISNSFGNIIVHNSIIYNTFSGIELGVRGNNSIIDNTISSNGDTGILVNYFPGISSNLIIGNYISNHTYGMRLSGFTNFVSNNTIVDNKVGIDLRGEKNNITNNSIINSSSCGLNCYWDSSDNMISYNSFLNNGIVCAFQDFNEFNNNTVNGKPFILLKKVSGILIKNAGEIILFDCNNITIQNSDLSHATRGLVMYNTNDCNITNNNFSYNNVGIYFSYSTRNHFTENNFVQNGKDVSFIINYLEIHNNIWVKNYYSKKISFLPKIMVGTVETRYKSYIGGEESSIYRIGFIFDWNSVKKPYVNGCS
jgi:parallel beta-helix repeat protein